MLGQEELLQRGPLVVLDLANNHNGSEDHARSIISSVAVAAKGLGLNVAVKFQYRQLDSFIHPDFQDRFDYPYVKRFRETELSMNAFGRLTDYAKNLGLLTSATPFDEESVGYVVEHGHAFCKVASVSLTDWPLAETVAISGLPVLASTAGSSVAEVDRAVSFYSRRVPDFAIMHCVAAYPTRDEDLQLGRIGFLADRYPHLAVGYSTHEDPNNLLAVGIAIGQGALILERHVGISSDPAPLNGYSSNPAQLRAWLESVALAGTMLGGEQPVSQSEIESVALSGLRRGVYVRTPISPGERIENGSVFFAIPLQPGQVAANDWSAFRTAKATRELRSGEPLLWEIADTSDDQARVHKIAEDVKALLIRAAVPIPIPADLEISHHYGLERFEEVGCAMITLVNRTYCKKLIMVKAGQWHPEQYHALKEETFHFLYGTIRLALDGIERVCSVGDVVTIMPGVRHEFVGVSDAVIEELSTTHIVDDSYYSDKSIAANSTRKTLIRFWT